MPTIQPLFSILIPSVPSRVVSQLLPLMAKLQAQIDSAGAQAQVEILCVLDNKTRSIGLKRDDLVQRARGEWLAFVDDDDDVSERYIVAILNAIALDKQTPHDEQVQVIVFDQWTRINDDEPRRVRHSIMLPNTELSTHGATRKPWHHNVWRASLAKLAHFPDSSYGEDSAWLEQLWPLVHRERRINGAPLHLYRYSDTQSQAEYLAPEIGPGVLTSDQEGDE